jgi:hypothetical protein
MWQCEVSGEESTLPTGKRAFSKSTTKLSSPDLTLLASRMVRNKFLLLNPPSMAMCYSVPSTSSHVPLGSHPPKANTPSTLGIPNLLDLPIRDFSCTYKHIVWVLCVWLLSFIMLFSNFIHVPYVLNIDSTHQSAFHSFSFSNNIPLYTYTVCDIVVWKRCIWSLSLFLAHSSSNPWNLQSDQSLLYNYDMTCGYWLMIAQVKGWLPEKPRHDRRVGIFSPIPYSPGKGGDWMLNWSPVASDVINHA